MMNRQHDWTTMSTDDTISTSSLASWRVRNRKLADPLAEGPIDGCWIEWHASTSMIQLVSNVRPSSNENDCCHRAEDGVMPFQVEAHLGCPSAEKVVRWCCHPES